MQSKRKDSTGAQLAEVNVISFAGIPIDKPVERKSSATQKQKPKDLIKKTIITF